MDLIKRIIHICIFLFLCVMLLTLVTYLAVIWKKFVKKEEIYFKDCNPFVIMQMCSDGVANGEPFSIIPLAVLFVGAVASALIAFNVSSNGWDTFIFPWDQCDKCDICNQNVKEVLYTVSDEYICYDCIIEDGYKKCNGCEQYYDDEHSDPIGLYCYECYEEIRPECSFCDADRYQMAQYNLGGQDYYICDRCVTEYFRNVEPIVILNWDIANVVFVKNMIGF